MRRLIYIDNITIIYNNGIEKVYNVAKKDNRFYLRTEDEPLIESISIENSKLITNYSESTYKRSIHEILNIEIEEYNIKNKYPGFSIEGTLLTYDSEMAEKYGLDEELAIDATKFKKRVRTKEEQ